MDGEFINEADLLEAKRAELQLFDCHVQSYYSALGTFFDRVLQDGFFGAVEAATALSALQHDPGHGSVNAVVWRKSSTVHTR